MFDDVTIINFAAGCGGSFLGTWLTTAKYNYKEDLEFTDFGSMHSQKYREIDGHNSGLFDDFNAKLEHIKRSLSFLPSIYNQRYPPYYTTIHSNINYIKLYFSKIINITYKNRDVYDIASCYLIKIQKGLDHINYTTVNDYTEILLKTKDYFYPLKSDNICNLSWYDVQYNNVDNLISKLSLFTGIPKTNFNSQSIINWRNKNKENIALVNNKIYRK